MGRRIIKKLICSSECVLSWIGLFAGYKNERTEHGWIDCAAVVYEATYNALNEFMFFW